MYIFKYKLLCGTIFIPFAVHCPMNPPPFIGKGEHSSGGDHRQGNLQFCFGFVDTSITANVKCNRNENNEGIHLVDFSKQRPFTAKGMSARNRIGDACGLVPVRMHVNSFNSGPFIEECTFDEWGIHRTVIVHADWYQSACMLKHKYSSESEKYPLPLHPIHRTVAGRRRHSSDWYQSACMPFSATADHS